MSFKLKIAAVAILAVSLTAAFGQTSQTQSPAKKHAATKRVKTPAPPSVEEQIQALRHELESQANQINSLKTGMADKDAQLQKAQQAAVEAQASAAKAASAASAQQQAVADNAAAVTTLQTTVTDLKGNQASLATTVSDETAKIKKAIDSPTVLHFKGITLAPGGFVEGDTAFRSHATASEMATAFSTIPYEHADSYSLTEFFGSSRPSRIALMAEGKVKWGTLRGYYEGDFMGSAVSSNENQTNSYVLRQRLLYAQAETNAHWTFTAGQSWSLVTETKKGITSIPADILTPLTVDPNYVAGYVWSRQYGFRVVKTFSKVAFAVAMENPQILYTASLAGNTPYAVVGAAGGAGGAMNASISSCSPTTSIVNYTNEVETTSGGQTVNVAVPVYKTMNSCANMANVSFNQAPDILVKAAFDPGIGHYEIFGVARFAHETVYPGETTNGNLYGGLKDITTGLAVAPALTTTGSFSESIVLGGMGGSLRIPVVANKLTVGAKGLFGPGVGRYGDSTLSDVTSNAAGRFVPIHNLIGLLTVEATPNPRLVIWANYGGDYAGREDYGSALTTTLGAPTTAQNASGVWGGTWKAPTAAAVGYGSRLLSNSSCNVTTNPSYNGSSTGYYGGGSCGAQTRNVQEVTGGYWYDIYKGDRGRLRQGFQYAYAVREGWSGVDGIGAKGVENMIFTSLRYYLP